MNYKETIYLHGPELIQYYGLKSHFHEGKLLDKYVIQFKSLSRPRIFDYMVGSIENPELKCFIPLVIK